MLDLEERLVRLDSFPQIRNPKSAMGKDLMSAPQFRNSQSLPAATSAAQAGAIRN